MLTWIDCCCGLDCWIHACSAAVEHVDHSCSTFHLPACCCIHLVRHLSLDCSLHQRWWSLGRPVRPRYCRGPSLPWCTSPSHPTLGPLHVLTIYRPSSSCPAGTPVENSPFASPFYTPVWSSPKLFPASSPLVSLPVLMAPWVSLAGSGSSSLKVLPVVSLPSLPSLSCPTTLTRLPVVLHDT